MILITNAHLDSNEALVLFRDLKNKRLHIIYFLHGNPAYIIKLIGTVFTPQDDGKS